MREVEIKARLKDKNTVIKKLADMGCVFEPEVTQLDTVYVQNVGSLEDYHSNKNYLRLRVKNNGKVLFTIKQPLKRNWLDKIEHETEISSKDEMEKAILLMGYQKAVVINKKRIITHCGGFEICIDDVEGLGAFIEIEKMTEDGNTENIQSELYKFSDKLGILQDDRVVFGYDILMLGKK